MQNCDPKGKKQVLEIKKPNKPNFFELWIKNKQEYSYQLREFMLEKEQQNVCCYCEKGITPSVEHSHIEHIRPQSKFKKLQHDYNNLVVSCQTKGRCGNAKGDKFNEPKLVGARRTLFFQLNQMRDSLDDFENWFKEYPTFIKYFKENYQE